MSRVPHGYEHLIGKWILCHGAARLHYRGRLVGFEEGRTATRLYVHPSFCIYNWDAEASPASLNERKRNTTADLPDVLIAEHFTRVGVQPEGWPK